MDVLDAALDVIEAFGHKRRIGAAGKGDEMTAECPEQLRYSVLVVYPMSGTITHAVPEFGMAKHFADLERHGHEVRLRKAWQAWIDEMTGKPAEPPPCRACMGRGKRKGEKE